MAMVLMHDMQDAPQADRVFALGQAGFSGQEIAELIGTSHATERQQLYQARKGGSGRRKKAPRKKPAKRGAKKSARRR